MVDAEDALFLDELLGSKEDEVEKRDAFLRSSRLVIKMVKQDSYSRLSYSFIGRRVKFRVGTNSRFYLLQRLAFLSLSLLPDSCQEQRAAIWTLNTHTFQEAQTGNASTNSKRLSHSSSHLIR